MIDDIERRDAGQSILRAFAIDDGSIDDRALDKVGRALDFVCSTEDEDGHGTVIDQASWKLDRYRKNPVVFWNHRSSGGFFGDGEPKNEIPIARAENIRVDGSQLKVRIVFPSAGESELSDDIFKACVSKRVNATSVGFRPGKVAKESIDGRERYRLFNCELFEVSLVGLPSNPNCIAERSMLEKLAGGDTATNDTPAAPAATATAPHALTETRMDLTAILARMLGCTADEASIIAALEGLKVRAAEPKIEAIAGTLLDATGSFETERRSFTAQVESLQSIVRSFAESLGVAADAPAADVTKAIVALQGRATIADELEPRVAELGKVVSDHEAAIAEREVSFIVTRGKQYGLSIDARSKKALLALRKADPKTFAEDYKPALDGLRAFDESELFERVAPEAKQTEPVVPTTDPDSEFEARVAAYMKKTGCLRSVAIGAVMKDADLTAA
jgi:hypothetical protein